MTVVAWRPQRPTCPAFLGPAGLRAQNPTAGRPGATGRAPRLRLQPAGPRPWFAQTSRDTPPLGSFVRRMFYSSVEFVGGSGRGESAWGCLGPFDVGPGAGRPEARRWASEPWASGGLDGRLLCLWKRLPCRWLTGPQSCVSVTHRPGHPCSVSGSPQKGPGEEWLCFALFCLHYLRSSNLALWGHTRHPGEETWGGVGRLGLAARLLPVLFLASCPAVQPQQMLKGMFLKMKNRSRMSRSLSGSVTDRSEVL